MDENYLDSLLEGVSTDKQQNTSFDTEVNMDSGIDIDLTDLDAISLDELDELDDLDLGDLDIDDIDFDDVDVTSITPRQVVNETTSSEEEDFSLEDLLSSDAEHTDDGAGEEFDLDSLFSDSEPVVEEEPVKEMDFDSLFSDVSEDATQSQTAIEETSVSTDSLDFSSLEQGSSGNIDIDDLFSALGIEDEEEQMGEMPELSGIDNSDFDALFGGVSESSLDDELADILDINDTNNGSKPKKKSQGKDGKKKSFSEVLFGEPDADDLEEEKLYQKKKAEKAERKEKKKADKEVKLEAKKEAQEQKNLANKAKEQLKLKKKKDKEAVLLAELEAEKNEKKVSNVTVIIVFMIFIVIGILVVMGTKAFDYSQVIKKATDYFERDRYSLAYDEVAGVEVKEEDQELKDRIYTVMYVERLYESYENNMSLGRYDKALDALLRGIEKYDVHYLEAVELDIVEDVDLVKSKIILALSNDFGLTEAEAYAIMELEGKEYSQALIENSEGLSLGE